MQAAKTALEAQLLLVVAQNPWVCGILAKGKDGKTCLRFPTTPTEADVKKMVKVVTKGEATKDQTVDMTMK